LWGVVGSRPFASSFSCVLPFLFFSAPRRALSDASSAWRFASIQMRVLPSCGTRHARRHCLLDAQGRQTDGEAAMLAFAGAVMKGNRITAFNVLRVGGRDYRRFLSAWASWLRESGVSAALSDRAA
jgi:hypothetical protein